MHFRNVTLQYNLCVSFCTFFLLLLSTFPKTHTNIGAQTHINRNTKFMDFFAENKKQQQFNIHTCNKCTVCTPRFCRIHTKLI